MRAEPCSWRGVVAAIVFGMNFFFVDFLCAIRIYLFIYLKFYLLFRAVPVAYGGSQARGPIGAVAAGLHHSHSNVGSGLHL